jgi:hypothetical protein
MTLHPQCQGFIAAAAEAPRLSSLYALAASAPA